LAAAALVFFALQFLSHGLYFLGVRRSDAPVYFKLSGRLFPIDAAPLTEYGLALLERSRQAVTPGEDAGPKTLTTGIDYLARAIDVNMLYYQAHFYLGNAYLLQTASDPTLMNQAVTAFKRAAKIRGRHTRLAMDTMNLLLSLWPFLKEPDRAFCSELLDRSIKRLSPGQFDDLLDTWGRYSRDTGFFKDVLQKRPDFYRQAAAKLLDLNINLEARQELLSSYAAYKLVNLQKNYRHYQDHEPPGRLEKLKQLHRSLINSPSIHYYLLKPAGKFNRKNYFDLKKRLDLDILDLLFSQKGWHTDPGLQSQIRTFIFSYIDDFSSIDELMALRDFLARRKYFERSHSSFGIFYIEQLLKFKSGLYDPIISDTENLRKSVSYVKPEHRRDYCDILLLLTDVYISSGLLIQALGVINEIETTAAPGRLTEIFWLKMQVEEVVGPEKETDNAVREEKERRYELIRGSREIELSGRSLETAVYSIDNHDIEIRLGDALAQQMDKLKLLQVFVDGRLFYEVYPGQATFPLHLTLPGDRKYSRFTVGIKIL
jgi:hypothetical protein